MRVSAIRLLVTLLIAWLAAAHAGEAQDVAPGFVHRHWTTRDGLPVNGLTDVLQARDGYLWIGTWDGLVRFDGVRFTVFHMGNTDVLPSNRVTHLLETPDGRLRFVTARPASVMEYHRGRFTRLDDPEPVEGAVRAILSDPEGTTWIGADLGLYRIRDGAGERLHRVKEIRGSALAIGPAGALWVGQHTSEGVLEVRGDGSYRRVVDSLPSRGLVTELLFDPDGTLWIGADRGLLRLRDGRLMEVEPPAGPTPAVQRLTRDGGGTLWVQTSGSGALLRLEGARLVAAEPPRRTDEPGRRPSADGGAGDRWSTAGQSLLLGGAEVFRAASIIVRHVEDREGNVWVATFNGGLHQLRHADVRTVQIPGDPRSRSTTAVLEDPSGTVWIGTPTGRLYRARGGVADPVPGFDGGDWLTRDASGVVWSGFRVLATGTGAPERSVVQALTRRPEADHGLARGDRFVGTVQGRDGERWFVRGTGGWVARYSAGAWTDFTVADGLPTEPIYQVYVTRDGAVWFLTLGGGLVRFTEGRFERLTTADGLADDFVRGFHEDADGVVWVGSYGRGLSRIDARGVGSLAQARIRVVRAREGLADDVVHQILEDDRGRFWIGSNRGIFAVPRADLNALAEGRLERVHSVLFDESHGMKNREVNGGGFSSGWRSRDGRLWFPTQDGVAVIDPSRLTEAPSLQVFVESVVAGDSVHVSATDLRLRPGARDFEVHYTAPSFVRPEQLRFRYRLDGYHADWVEADTRRTAYFTNLAPGRYTFRVAVTNGDGAWTEAGAPLLLTVEPFFHETGWFRALLGVALLIGALTAGGLRAGRARSRARTLERLVAERTADLAHEKEVTARQAAALADLDRAKNRFLANLSHEFRTPLTLIMGPLRDLVDGRRGPLPSAVREQHRIMLRNAKRLLRLINQVLDLARLESGGLALRTEPYALEPWVRGHVRSFAVLAEQRGIDLRFHARPEAEHARVALDAEEMEKVLLNLLSNAFKFTGWGGSIEVVVRQEAERATIEVRDTGIGIEPAALPRIFDRFYQADNSTTRRHEGSGIGLSLARELVELHGGAIEAESRPGEGSVFRVHLPLLPAERGAGAPGEPAVEAGPVPAVAGPGRPPAASPLPRGGNGVVPIPREEHELDAGSPVSREAAAPDGADTADRTTVLVVDDNTDVRAYVRSVLDPAFRVLEAADGQEGLAVAREALPDLVLADVMMPRLDGMALARALRADPATDCIPVVLLTARAATGDEVEGLGTGADDYVTKPFDAAVLEARIANLIAMRRRLRERFRQEGVPAAAPAAGPAPARSELEARLRAAVEAHLTDPAFNPEALAAAAGLSYKQLYLRLRDELDATPSHFIRTVRVERAADLLREGAGSVTEVAYSVGFNSLSHFNRCFRDRFGIAPSELLRTPA
jgi:signal transduction histidine kinase/ligand-binding sensor domain-containing protein/DNA-binding response OmpR family regulator